MRRRDFIKGIAGSASAWPLAARAQRSVMPVVGVLNNTTPEAYAPFVDSFRKGLRQAGYSEGQNVTIDYRWGRNGTVPLPDLADDLVRRGVAVIVASGGDQTIQAAKTATTKIPIVVLVGNDPVESGLVQSVNRPGGSITGVSVFATQLVSKRVELARELAPNAATVAFLENPANPNSKIDRPEFEIAAKSVGQNFTVLDATTEADATVAFAKFAADRVGATIIESDPIFNGITRSLVELAARYKLPTVFPRREFAVAGGLMSYGSSLSEAYRQAGIYAGRILNGDTPADLPVLFPTKFELVANLKTAKALGIQIPTSILLRADEVIE
jgi:putative tryptophan/tyrosine transport system substrate-binding protein